MLYQQFKGAGPLESDDKFGFFLHSLYSITEQWIPLGVVDHVLWTRESILSGLPKAQRESDSANKPVSKKKKAADGWRCFKAVSKSLVLTQRLITSTLVIASRI